MSTAYSGDGRYVAVGCMDGTIAVYSVAGGTLLYKLTSACASAAALRRDLRVLVSGCTNAVRALAFSHDSTLLYGGTDTNQLLVCRCDSGELLGTYAGHTGWVLDLDVTKAGRVATACVLGGRVSIAQRLVHGDVRGTFRSSDKTVRLLDPEGRGLRHVHTLDDHTDQVCYRAGRCCVCACVRVCVSCGHGHGGLLSGVGGCVFAWRRRPPGDDVG